MSQMPQINPDSITDPVAAEYARRISHKGALRASKPKIGYVIVPHPWGGNMRLNDLEEAKVAYVWRMVAFQVSPKDEHHCMPVCADMDLPVDDHAERSRLTDLLDTYVKAIVDSIPRDQWHGIRRWGQAFGLIGTPRLNAEGAVIYR